MKHDLFTRAGKILAGHTEAWEEALLAIRRAILLIEVRAHAPTDAHS
jgi:hypothetical protein